MSERLELLPTPSLISELDRKILSSNSPTEPQMPFSASFSATEHQHSNAILAAVFPPSWCHLSRLLERYPETAAEVELTILALKTAYPWIQSPLIILPDGPWLTDKPHYVHKSHIMTQDENYRIAADNIAATGRIWEEEDEKYLRYLLCYPSAWCATTSSHHEDAWVQYIRHQFPHVKNLRPILDDMTWPEEIKLLPGDYGPGFPEYQLLANATTFYFYNFDTDALFRAGNTLEEVYHGLRQRRWSFNPNGTAERWFIEPDCGSEEYDRYDYFPIWKCAEKE